MNLNLVALVFLSSCAYTNKVQTTVVPSRAVIWANEAERKTESKKVTSNLATKQQPKYKLTIMPIHFTSKIKMTALKQHLLQSFRDVDITNQNEVKDSIKELLNNSKNSSDYQNEDNATTSLDLPKTYLLRISPNHPKKTLRRVKRNPDEETSVDDLNEFFANLRENDDDTCLARMVCEMATGHPAFGHFGRDITEVLLSLESDDPHAPWKYYKRAALIGRRTGSGHVCARRYHICRASFEDLVYVSHCLQQGEDCFNQ